MNNLPDRIKILKNTPLYKGGDVLIDVGCATGYFETQLASKYNKIFAFCPNQGHIDKAIKSNEHLKNVSISCKTFGTFDFKDTQADMVFFGNCIHYVFSEYKGWGFLKQVLQFATKYLIIEYPYDINQDASDMIVLKKSLKEKGIDKLFTKEKLLEELLPYFTLEQTLKSGSTTREIIVLRRNK